jgi:UDP-N-acetylmuramoyl-tripeptide--D-alanyl-D-alanine ligase
MRWTPGKLAEMAEGRLVRAGTQAAIAGAFIDSRQPVPGALFVPIVAARDGHDFIAAAVAGGAAAVLVGPGRAGEVGDAAVTVVEVDDTLAAMTRLAAAARNALSGPVVAITGSNGKTTTRAMIAAVVATGYPELLCTRGNLNNHLGVPLTLLGEPHEPSAMVVELGMSAPGENDRLAAVVRPTIAVITSVAIEHLEFMGSIEAIAAAEAEPIGHVTPDGVVLVPGDEPLLTPHLPASCPRVVRFAAGAGARVRVVDVVAGVRTVATLAIAAEGDVPEQRVEVRLQTFGAHNARNAAAAMCVGLELGLPVAQMVAALESVAPVGDRGRLAMYGEHLVVADCYNANPGSVEAALRSLTALSSERSGPLVAVLGDMLELGSTEVQLHREIGTLCAELGLDAVVGFGRLTKHLVDAAREGGIEAEFVGEDIDLAVDATRRLLGEGDAGAVLVKGSRGVRLERVVDGLGAIEV